MSVYNLNDVSEKPVTRFSTGIEGLDWMYGGGLAEGKISIWSAAMGLGKSRTAIEICKSINRLGHTILYVTCELDPGSFKAEKLKGFDSPNFYISDSRSKDDIIEEILQVMPKFVIIDSVNVIKEYGRSRDSAEMLIDGIYERVGKDMRQIEMGMRQAAEMTSCHIVLIAQQNADGSTKGGTSLGHWCDTEAFFFPYYKGIFSMEITRKHRQGVAGRCIMWEHRDWGVNWSREHWLEKIGRGTVEKRPGFISRLKFW